jgi:predicted dehydrogenase
LKDFDFKGIGCELDFIISDMNERIIGVGLLSYGMSGEVFHGPLLEAHPYYEIRSVLHRSKSKSITHRYPVVYNINEILDDEKIALVVVNTPSPLHYEHTVQALNANKHVVVEKPFTVTSREADELIALARKKNKILTVFQNRRWDGEFLTLKKVIELRLVGKIVELEAHYDRFRNLVDHTSWKEKGQAGTGVLYNLGSHMLDQILVLFGLPGYVDARIGVQRPGGVSDDFYDIRMAYSDFYVIVKSSYLVKEPGPRYMLHGVDGSFIKSGLDPQEEDLKNKKIPGSTGWGMEPKSLWGKLNTLVNGKEFNGPYESIPGII